MVFEDAPDSVEGRRAREIQHEQESVVGAIVPDPANFRIVLRTLGSVVDVYFLDVNDAGEPCWERLHDGVTFRRFHGVTIWRRLLLAEGMRRLAGKLGEDRPGVVRAPTGARRIRLEDVEEYAPSMTPSQASRIAGRIRTDS